MQPKCIRCHGERPKGRVKLCDACKEAIIPRCSKCSGPMSKNSATSTCITCYSGKAPAPKRQLVMPPEGEARAICPTVRPCPYTGCRYHTGSDDQQLTCSLDIAACGEHTMELVAGVLGVSQQRIEQIEKSAIEKLKKLRVHLDVPIEHNGGFGIAPSRLSSRWK